MVLPEFVLKNLLFKRNCIPLQNTMCVLSKACARHKINRYHLKPKWVLKFTISAQQHSISSIKKCSSPSMLLFVHILRRKLLKWFMNLKPNTGMQYYIYYLVDSTMTTPYCYISHITHFCKFIECCGTTTCSTTQFMHHDF